MEDHRTMRLSVLVSKNQLFHFPENQRTNDLPNSIFQEYPIDTWWSRNATVNYQWIMWQRHGRVAADMCIITALPSQPSRPVAAQRLLSARYISVHSLRNGHVWAQHKIHFPEEVGGSSNLKFCRSLIRGSPGRSKKKPNSSTLVTTACLRSFISFHI